MLTLSQRLKVAAFEASMDNFASCLLTGTTNSSQSGNTVELCSSINLLSGSTVCQQKQSPTVASDNRES